MRRAYLGWGILAGTAGGYEGYLLLTHQPTLSEAVWYGPLWFKIAMAVGLSLLLWHFFIQRKVGKR